MPPTCREGSPALFIELAERNTYSPGDTIIGTVNRKEHTVCPNATVRIRLRGRCKAKYSQGNAQNRTHYRSRINFFDTSPIFVTLHRGPVHIAPDDRVGQSWPFAITIPTQLEHGIPRLEGDATFIKAGHPKALEIPPSFLVDETWSNMEGFVEYNLEATYVVDPNHRPKTAVMPFIMLPPLRGGFIEDFELTRLRQRIWVVRSYLIDPAKADAKLTFKEKSQALFGSSKVPTLGINIQVTVPQILQIGHPDMIPFLVQAFPNDSHTSDPVKGTNPRIEVNRLKVSLYEYSEIVVPTTFSKRYATESQKRLLVEFERPRRQRVRASSSAAAQKPDPPASTARSNGDGDGLAPPEYEKKDHRASMSALETPQINAAEPPPDASDLIVPLNNAPEPLNLGQALGLTMNMWPRISTSFTAFNVRVRHAIRWKMQVQVADEKEDFEGEEIVTIIQ